MTDTQKPEPTAPTPKGSPWLEQVKRDAERITLKRMRDAEEEQKYKEEKAEA